jgi:hypothetical protein
LDLLALALIVPGPPELKSWRNPESKNGESMPIACQTLAHRLPMDCQSLANGLPMDCQTCNERVSKSSGSWFVHACR